MTDLISAASAIYGWKYAWTISGAATAPTDFTKSDGYQVKSTGTRTAQTVTSGEFAEGACVETLDSAGAALTSTTGTNMGNYGTCHIARIGAATVGGTATADQYLAISNMWHYLQTISSTQWGTTDTTIGAVVTGAAAPTATSVSATDYNVIFNPLNTVTGTATTTMEVTWLQPIQATTYSGLRRYSKDEKVKAYRINATAGATDGCTAACILNASADGAVTLTGAVALASGAAALAVASLAF